MNINIYTKRNGVGLEADANILKAALADHQVTIYDWDKSRRVDYATVGIHLEHIRKEYLTRSGLNLLIPNPEWFDRRFHGLLKHIDVVLCKTQDAIRIFSAVHNDCRYIGFTSLDRNSPAQRRREFLHLAGKSSHKGTDQIFQLWQSHDMPSLTLQRLEKKHILEKKNYTFVGNRVDDIGAFLSGFQFHLCPSECEGFGHYINEALSTGAIVITTDAAPMNELVSSDYGILVKAHHVGQHNWGSRYVVDINDLKEKIEMCSMLPDWRVQEMSRKAREAFENRDRKFRLNIKNFMRCVVP
jgi:glycosyltransferase involved in cell wall biosynthesis